MSEPCPEDCSDLWGLSELAELIHASSKTHRIGVVAQKSADPWTEPCAFVHQFEDVDGEEEHESDGHTHVSISWAIAFEFGYE